MRIQRTASRLGDKHLEPYTGGRIHIRATEISTAVFALSKSIDTGFDLRSFGFND